MTRRGVAAGRGYTVLETLVALTLIALVVVSTGRVIVNSLSFIGSTGTDRDFQRAARARTQAIEWTQAAVEFVRKLGFANVTTNCGGAPCLIPPGSPPGGATVPFNQGPPLPAGFQCGRVILEDWDGAGGFEPGVLRLVTIEIYRGGANCTDIGPTPYLTARTGISARSAPPTP